jgi:hypothetical protein
MDQCNKSKRSEILLFQVWWGNNRLCQITVVKNRCGVTLATYNLLYTTFHSELFFLRIQLHSA